MTNFSLTLYLLKTLREESKSGQIKIYRKRLKVHFLKAVVNKQKLQHTAQNLLSVCPLRKRLPQGDTRCYFHRWQCFPAEEGGRLFAAQKQ